MSQAGEAEGAAGAADATEVCARSRPALWIKRGPHGTAAVSVIRRVRTRAAAASRPALLQLPRLVLR